MASKKKASRKNKRLIALLKKRKNLELQGIVLDAVIPLIREMPVDEKQVLFHFHSLRNKWDENNGLFKNKSAPYLKAAKRLIESSRFIVLEEKTLFEMVIPDPPLAWRIVKR